MIRFVLPLIIGFFLMSLNSRTEAIDFDRLSSDKPSLLDPADRIQLFAEWVPYRLTGGSETSLIVYGRIDPDQHIYSIHQQGDAGPEPTRIKLDTKWLTPVSDLNETQPLAKYDASFEGTLMVHINEFQFDRRFRLAPGVSPGVYQIRGHLLFQICSDRICSLLIKKPFSAEMTVE